MSHRVGGDAHVARVPSALEPHIAAGLREDRVVGAQPDVEPGLHPRTTLADADGPSRHDLTGETLHAEHLGIGIPAVPRAPDAFLVSHRASDLDLGDADRRRRLMVSTVPPIMLATLEFHD